MRYITDKKFNNLECVKNEGIVLGDHKLKYLNTKYLIKEFPADHKLIRNMKRLTKLNIENVNLPLHIYKILGPEERYAYTQKYLKNFQQLPYFNIIEKNYSEKEILTFYLNLLKTLQKMHQNNINSGDIHTSNILIDENLSYNFIDFDLHTRPIFIQNYKPQNLMKLTNQERLNLSDKTALLMNILISLLYGKFPNIRITMPLEISEIKKLSLPSSIESKILDFINFEKPLENEDYLLEEFSTLINSSYTLPYRK